MPEILQFSFMIRAFLAGMMIAIIAPLIGNFLVVKKYSLISDTLSHIALSGVAIGLLFGTQPLIATVILTSIVALVIEQLRTNNRIPGDAVLAMFLPGGLALSVILINMAHGFDTNILNYLFGSITTVKTNELWTTLTLGIVTVVSVVMFYSQLVFVSFDEESAAVHGIHTRAINAMLVILTAVTVSLSMRVVGVLLVGALMVIPVVTAMQFARSFFESIILSIVFALGAVLCGITISFYFDLPAGATVVLFSLGVFALVATMKRLQFGL